MSTVHWLDGRLNCDRHLEAPGEPWELHRDARAAIGEARAHWETAARYAGRGCWLAAIERRDEGAIAAVLAVEALLWWLAGLSAD